MQSDHFEEKFSLIDMNVPTTVVAFGISIVEGISIGIISGRLLKVRSGSKFTMDCVHHIYYDGVCIGLNLLITTNKNGRYVYTISIFKHVPIFN